MSYRTEQSAEPLVGRPIPPALARALTTLAARTNHEEPLIQLIQMLARDEIETAVRESAA